jgi:hypothetical protein
MSDPTVMDLHEAGWSLIPVRSDKRPLLPTWREFQTQRATAAQITAWESQLRPRIWAGVTGRVSGTVTLDFDGPAGVRTLGQLGLDPHRETPGGGFHVDFTAPDRPVSTVNGRSKQVLGAEFPGLDVRGDGGYINLLGQTTEGRYRWVDRSRAAYSLDVLPEPLRRLLDLVAESPSEASLLPRGVQPPAHPRPAASETAVETLLSLALHQAQFGRNDAGFWLATQLRDHGFAEDEAWEVMQDFVERAPLRSPRGALEPYTLAEARASLEQAYSREPREPFLDDSGMPLINSKQQLRLVTVAAQEALADANVPPRLFARNGEVVRLSTNDAGAPRVEPLDVDMMVAKLAEIADWVRPTQGGGLASVYPPTSVARSLLDVERLDVPPLNGLIEAPTLRPDGSVLQQPGYDAQTGLFYQPDTSLIVPPVPERPSEIDVVQAVGMLRHELLREFRFEQESDAANALALQLTAVLRHLIRGPVPLAVIDAPVAGSGKTMLASMIAMVATGRPASLTSPPDGNDEELRKRFTSLLREDRQFIVFDNAAKPVISPVLAQLLTAETWNDRVLGVSRTVDLRQRATWVLTGNNVEIGGDLPRRVYSIRLDPGVARPELRHFDRPDLAGWVKQQRGELLWSVLVIARAWFDAGKPRPANRVDEWGSFNDWAYTVGGMLENAGVEGFLQSRSVRSAKDDEATAWEALLQVSFAQFGDRPFAPGALIQSLGERLGDVAPSRVVRDLDRATSPSSAGKRLSNQFRQIADRRFGESQIRITSAGRNSHTKTEEWQIAVEDVRHDPRHSKD